MKSLVDTDWSACFAIIYDWGDSSLISFHAACSCSLSRFDNNCLLICLLPRDGLGCKGYRICGGDELLLMLDETLQELRVGGEMTNWFACASYLCPADNAKMGVEVVHLVYKFCSQWDLLLGDVMNGFMPPLSSAVVRQCCS